MPRNSEIFRLGVGDRVEALSGDGMSHPDIASTVSDECGHHISMQMVGRHLHKTAVTATVMPEEHSALDRLAADIVGDPDTRDSAESAYFGLYKLDTTNVFTSYYGIARGMKNGQVMRGFKNIALKITNGAYLSGDEKDVEKIDALSKTLNFSPLLQNVVRSTCEMGTGVVGLRSSDGNLMTPQLLPMQYITLLTANETLGTVGDSLVTGTVNRAVVNEGGSGQLVYEPEDMGLFRIWDGGNSFTDILGRKTFGIYGESMTVGVETPLKSQMNSAFYYDAFIQRYGLGRLHFNLTLLAEMVKEKKITPVAAQSTQEADAAAGQKIAPNEDIYSTGRDVSMIESKTGFNIVPYLEWRGVQIDRALLQSDVASGDVGSSWTSSGTAVSAQELVALQSMRDTFFEMFMTSVVEPYLPDYGLAPGSVSIVAEPLSQAPVPYSVLTDWVNLGIISEGETRVRAGFEKEKPDEV